MNNNEAKDEAILAAYLDGNTEQALKLYDEAYPDYVLSDLEIQRLKLFMGKDYDKFFLPDGTPKKETPQE